MLAHLADRLELERPTDSDGDVAAAAALLMHDTQAGIVGAVGQMASRAEAKTVKTQLTEMHARLTKLYKEVEPAMAELRERRRKMTAGAQPVAPAAPARAVTLAWQTNARHVTELERDVIIVDDLIGRQRLEE